MLALPSVTKVGSAHELLKSGPAGAANNFLYNLREPPGEEHFLYYLREPPGGHRLSSTTTIKPVV